MPRKKNILVIDDEEAIRRSFVLALEDTGYVVTTVDSGEKGIEAVKEGNFHLVFLDLKMPGMNGAQVLQKLREISLTLPVYIVTSFHKKFLAELDVVRKKGLPFQLLRKPIGSNEIRALAQSVLEKPVRLI